uniref:28S ribosomal protein S14, mitochondrial n=1 Tax=Lutzomyia longipalpis TaxID=7200 RepID=A0A1B0ET84_LUTLO
MALRLSAREDEYTDNRMRKDVKRRKIVEEHAVARLRVNSLRKNDILPIELREIADAEIHAFPRDSCLNRVRERCCITSRPRGVVHRWRMSRIMWRHLADYNKLSGVQRAMW